MIYICNVIKVYLIYWSEGRVGGKKEGRKEGKEKKNKTILNGYRSIRDKKMFRVKRRILHSTQIQKPILTISSNYRGGIIFVYYPPPRPPQQKRNRK